MSDGIRDESGVKRVTQRPFGWSLQVTFKFPKNGALLSPCLSAGRQKIVNSTTWWIDWRYRERDGRTDQYQCVCFFYVTFFPFYGTMQFLQLNWPFKRASMPENWIKKVLCFEIFSLTFSGNIWEVCSKSVSSSHYGNGMKFPPRRFVILRSLHSLLRDWLLARFSFLVICWLLFVFACECSLQNSLCCSKKTAKKTEMIEWKFSFLFFQSLLEIHLHRTLIFIDLGYLPRVSQKDQNNIRFVNIE